MIASAGLKSTARGHFDGENCRQKMNSKLPLQYMPYGKYRFFASFEDEALLPPFKGSTFRGVFGVALKRVVCPLRGRECLDCLLRRQCVYARVFENLTTRGDKAPSPPHPFVIEPMPGEATRFYPGDPFAFTLLLFGWANDYLPYFVYAFEEMGKIGIGRHINDRRAGFRLDRVELEDEVVYDGKEQNLVKKSPSKLFLGEREAEGSVSAITLLLQTPMRLKFQNSLKAELPFHVLIRACLRRIATLNQHYGAGEPALDYRGLVARSQAVAIRRADLHWYDWRRYSNRQDQGMLMGGMVGSITYRGDLAEYMPLLKYAEKVHLGKATTFGLGKVRVTADQVS